MGANSSIEWTTHTFNPWMGCMKISPACKFCYAEADRKMRGQLLWGPGAPRQVTSAAYWRQPLKWDREARESDSRPRVFCGSLCDVMEDFDGKLINGGCCIGLQEIREHLYNLIEQTPNLDWMLLTKRPENYRRFLPQSWLENPRPNVWGMTTVESADYLWRVTELLSVPFVVRGLSMEPLLGPIAIPDPFLTLYRRGLVIVGGESGHNARPMHPDWARSLRDQCARAGVPFHFKQYGEWQWGSSFDKPHLNKILLNDGRLVGSARDAGIDTQNNWPEFRPTMVAKVGKKSTCRVLDGRTWDEMPGVTP